jgi:hypothetical protein
MNSTSPKFMVILGIPILPLRTKEVYWAKGLVFTSPGPNRQEETGNREFHHIISQDFFLTAFKEKIYFNQIFSISVTRGNEEEKLSAEYASHAASMKTPGTPTV